MSWKKVITVFGSPKIQKNKKWKRCNEYIIEFEKTLDAKTNEERVNVCDARFAKFRADKNSLITLRIYNAKKSQWEHKIEHKCGGFAPVIYEVGCLATPNGFDENINIVRGKGIHFFDCLLAAYWFSIVRLKEDIEFSENGEIKRIYHSNSTLTHFLQGFGLFDPKFATNFLVN